jgi:hypothetical protein
MGVQPDKMHLKREVRPTKFNIRALHKFSIYESRIFTSLGQNVVTSRCYFLQKFFSESKLSKRISYENSAAALRLAP